VGPGQGRADALPNPAAAQEHLQGAAPGAPGASATQLAAAWAAAGYDPDAALAALSVVAQTTVHPNRFPSMTIPGAVDIL
jgi:hypothetical protein